MKNKAKQYWFGLRNKALLVPIAVAAAGVGSASAAVDADATAIVTDVTAFFGDVKGFVFAVLGVSLVIGLIKWMKKGK